jgi:hypothetical protein
LIIALYLVWGVVALLLILAWHRVTTRRSWEIAALVGSLLLSLTHQVMFSTVAEDAFISLRYSMNLAEGHGLVFNAGEKVEGYSNFLWVILVAAPGLVADVDYVLVARALGVASTLCCVVLAYLLVRKLTGQGAAGAIAATLTAAATSLAAYGPSGLESSLFTMLLLGAVLAVHSERLLLGGLLLALATLTRPDGAVVALVVGCWILVRAIRRRPGVGAVASFAIGVLVIIAPWTWWRLSYYGHLLPNAVAAKSGAGLGWQLEVGWDYFVSFAIAAQAALVLVPMAMYRMISRRALVASPARQTIWLLFLIATVYLGFFISTGGDWMPAWRFFAPVVPLLLIAVVAAWNVTAASGTEADPTGTPPRPAAWSRIGAVATAVVSLLMLSVSTSHPSAKPAIEVWRQQVYDLSDIGAWVRRTMPAGTVISTYANGALSYQAGPEITVIDQLGLTDEHIARHGKRLQAGVIGHTAYDFDYLVNVRKPDVVFALGGGYLRALDCTVQAAFSEHYQAAAFQVQGEAKWAVAFLRNETAAHSASLLGRYPAYRQVSCPPD